MVARKKVLIPLVLMVAAGGAITWAVLARARNSSGVIRLSGNIEVTDAELSFKIPGRVDARFFDEGQIVKKGQTVAVLDAKDLEAEVKMREAELRQAQAAEKEAHSSRPEEILAAEAAWNRAEFALADLKAGSRYQEIQAAEAAQKQAEADLQRWESDYGRTTKLYKQGIVTREEYDRVDAGFRAARERLREATEKADLVKAGFRKDRIKEAEKARDQAMWEFMLVWLGPRQEKRDQAVAKRDQAADALRLAQIQLDYATLKAPLSGVVLSKNIEPGEYVSPGTPVVTVGDLEHVWLRAYINETDLGRVTYGQKASVTTDSRPGKVYEGRVSFISSQAEFTPKSVETKRERVKLVYRIKIDIQQNPKMELLPGMPADAEIKVE
jgi:HlyD family secretion protein